MNLYPGCMYATCITKILIILTMSDTGRKSVVGNPSNLGLILEHITILTEVQTLAINHRLSNEKVDTRCCGQAYRPKKQQLYNIKC